MWPSGGIRGRDRDRVGLVGNGIGKGINLVDGS